MSVDAIISSLERCAFAAWPAEHVEALDGWRMRATSGVTRRANSVWACEAFGPLALDARIDRVEAFYRSRGLPSLIHLTPVSAPAGLDAALERRGYRIEAPVSVQVADTRRVRERATPQVQLELDVSRKPSDDWLQVSVRRGRYAGVEVSYLGLLDRLRGKAHYALATVRGEPAAVGLGIEAGEWFGICSMLTLPAYRRGGVGHALISSLAETASAQGCQSLYLQVEADNVAALSLYAKAGFEPVYGTHYRLRDAQPGP